VVDEVDIIANYNGKAKDGFGRLPSKPILAGALRNLTPAALAVYLVIVAKSFDYRSEVLFRTNLFAVHDANTR